MVCSIVRRACGGRWSTRKHLSVTETELIERYFLRGGAERDDVVLGIGDDAALLRVPTGNELVLTTDALVEGRHFPVDAPARSLGHRALAVNLSDIAAMGASPTWALLSLNLPAVDENWLQGFAQGFSALAGKHRVALVGGNLTRGPLSITVQLAGIVPAGRALRRDGARAGDLLYVSGTPGDSARGLMLQAPQAGAAQAATDADRAYLLSRHQFPTPRVALGQALRDLASACIDVSDGLCTDAHRLLRASGCGAVIEIARLPLSHELRRCTGPESWQIALRGGEDYELCFTAPPAAAAQIQAMAMRSGELLTQIGTLTAGDDIILQSNDSVLRFSPEGFDHFRD
jgi:thiamine-monophosphate kinase